MKKMSNKVILQVRLKQRQDLGQIGQLGAPALSHVEEVPLASHLFSSFHKCLDFFFALSLGVVCFSVSIFLFVDSEDFVFSHLFLVCVLLYCSFLANTVIFLSIYDRIFFLIVEKV